MRLLLKERVGAFVLRFPPALPNCTHFCLHPAIIVSLHICIYGVVLELFLTLVT